MRVAMSSAAESKYRRHPPKPRHSKPGATSASASASAAARSARWTRAWITRLDREVALKLMPVALAAGAEAASSIIHEGRLLARVRHPNVVTIYGADEMDGYVGLWMELVPGRTLEELLRDGQTFEPGEVARIGLELARALLARSCGRATSPRHQSSERPTSGGRTDCTGPDFGTVMRRRR